MHDLVFWYTDAQPCLSRGISVATALYKRCDNVQPPIWEPDQTEIGPRSKKQNNCNQSTHCVSTQLHLLFCALQGEEAGNAREHPETDSWVTEDGGQWVVGNRTCLKVPIFADTVWAKGCCRRWSEPGWHSGSHYMTLRMPRGFLVYTQFVFWKWQSDWIMSQHPWSLASGVVTLGTSGDLWSQAFAKPYLMCSDWADLLPKTVHFLPFCWPCCYSGLWAGTAPRLAGIALGAGGLPAVWLTLHPACFPLNPLIPHSLALPFCPKIGSVLGKSSTHAPGRGGSVCPILLRSTACSAQQWGHFGVVTLNLSKVITLL